MENCSKLVFSLYTVLILTGTCYGCYTNYKTCFDEFRAIQLSASSNPLNYATDTCNAAIDAVTCLENDASNCTDSETAPSQYVSYKDTFTDMSSNCKEGAKRAVCTKTFNTCYDQLVEAATIFIQNKGWLDGVDGQYCPGLVTAVQCFRDMIPVCPSLAGQANQTVVQTESEYSAHCTSFQNPVLILTGCYTNYQTCMDEFNAIQLSTISNPHNYATDTCNAAIDAVTCLENDAINCTASDTAPSQYVTYRDIFTNLNSDCKETARRSACVYTLINCTDQTSEASNHILPLLEGDFSDESAVDKYCQGMDTGLQCYRELIPSCPFLEEQVNRTVQSYEAPYSSWCSVKGQNRAVCIELLRNCTNQTLKERNQLRSLVLPAGGRQRPDKSVLDRYCQFTKTTLHCYRNINVPPFCPPIEGLVNNTAAQYRAKCGADGLNSAPTTSSTTPSTTSSTRSSTTTSTTPPTTVSVCDGNDCNSGTMSVVNLMVTFIGVTLALI